MIPFFDFSIVEKISVDAVKQKFVSMKVDHMKNVVIFSKVVSFPSVWCGYIPWILCCSRNPWVIWVLSQFRHRLSFWHCMLFQESIGFVYLVSAESLYPVIFKKKMSSLVSTWHQLKCVESVISINVCYGWGGEEWLLNNPSLSYVCIVCFPVYQLIDFYGRVLSLMV